MTIYSIEQTGLRKLGKTNLKLQKNAEYYIGASSSPHLVVLTDFNSEIVHYKNYPYQERELGMERFVFEDLAMQGIKTWLDLGYEEYQPERAKSMRNLIEGREGRTIKISDFKPKIVTVRPNKNTFRKGIDYWRLAEHYGGVGGRDSADSPTGMLYVINTYAHAIKELETNKAFVILKVEDDPRG